jgi:hypothetical protein
MNEILLGCVVVLALCVAALAVWAARLEKDVKELRKAAGTEAGQPKGLEMTHEDQRPPASTDKRPTGRPMSLALQAGIREKAERILRDRARRSAAGVEGAS